MNVLRQSTAVDVLIGPFVDSTDGDTEEIALTIAQADVRLSKGGQPSAQKSDVTTAAHDADGFYNCEFDATDTNTTGILVLYVHVVGALAVRHEYQVVTQSVFDKIYASGSSINDIAATSIVSAGAITTLSGAVVNVALVDVTAVNTDMRGNDVTPPTVAQLDARTLLATNYATAANLEVVDTVADGIQADLSNVTDGLGAIKAAADGANTVIPLPAASTATSAAQVTAQNDLNLITGLDGATLATTQALYAPSKAGDAMSVAAGGIPVGGFASGAITADAIATDALGALEFAADAVQEIVDGIRQQVLSESYAADGVAPTTEQILFMIWSDLSDFAYTGTTKTSRRINGITTSMTHTLDSATDPTSKTRAT